MRIRLRKMCKAASDRMRVWLMSMYDRYTGIKVEGHAGAWSNIS